MDDLLRKALFRGLLKGSRGEANNVDTPKYQCGQQKASDGYTKNCELSIGQQFNIDAIIEDAACWPFLLS
jgi:hypothetical protein